MQKIMEKEPGKASILGLWGNPFSAASVISNRITKSHRDTFSRFEYMDILTSVGNFKDVYLHLESLGLWMELSPGCIVALCGKTLLHEVGTGEGDRVCLAWYMRNNVHASLDVSSASWMSWQTYENFVSST